MQNESSIRGLAWIHKQPIVFDLLDTLLDESGVYKKFYYHILKRYSLDFGPQEFVSRFFELQRKQIFADSKKPYKEITKAAYLELIRGADAKDLDVLFNLHKDMDFLPGIEDMLASLQENFCFFVLTNCSNDLIQLISLNRKSQVKFEKVFTSESNGVYKPNPRAYQTVVDYIKIPKEKIIYASSNGWDIEKSREFGFNVKSIEELKKL